MPAYRWMPLFGPQIYHSSIPNWKKLLSDFALTGVLALELYLKAYIFNSNRSYSKSHDITKLCQTWAKSSTSGQQRGANGGPYHARAAHT